MHVYTLREGSGNARACDACWDSDWLSASNKPLADARDWDVVYCRHESDDCQEHFLGGHSRSFAATAGRSACFCDIKSGGRTVAAANRANFAAFLNAGASAVRKNCPRAKIIVHCDHGDNWSDLAGVLDAAKKVDYDIFGVSLYPKEDWGAAVKACAANLERVKREYGKATMVCEFGMPTHPSAL